MTPTPKLSMQKQIRKKRERSPDATTRHCAGLAQLSTYHPLSFAFLASRMALRDRAKQADFFLRIRSCAPFASRTVLRDECVGLRSRGISLALSCLRSAGAGPGILHFARSVTPAPVKAGAPLHLFHGTFLRLVQALFGEFWSHTWLFFRLQTKNRVTGWTSQTVERQQLASAPVKAQSSLVFKCTLSTISCPTTLTCWPCRELTRANVHFGPRV